MRINVAARFVSSSRGHTHPVRVTDIAALPVRLGSAIRAQRLFHPAGVRAEGILERVAPEGEGLPVSPCDVLARLSTAIGLSVGSPDIAGLAWRMPPPADLRACGPWDMLLASTFANTRVVLAPTVSWSGASFSSLTPMRYRGGLWWVRARLSSRIDVAGLSLDAIEAQIESSTITFAIDQAPGFGKFRPLARLTLRHVDPSCDDIGFDPVLHSGPDVELAPRWLGRLRRAAYKRSRAGRE